MSVTTRSFFGGKKLTRSTTLRLPSTADIVIQTDDSLNMGDFRNWASDLSSLLNLNTALESESVGSTILGTQYFNRFATATLKDANLIPSKDWLGRNLSASSAFGTNNRSWIRKDFIDKYTVTIEDINLADPTGVGGFNTTLPVDRLVLPSGATQFDFIITHQTGILPSQGSGATFVVSLQPVVDSATQVFTGEYVVSNVTLATSGSGYTSFNTGTTGNNRIVLRGSQFGGTDGIHDIVLTGISLVGFNISVSKSDLDLGMSLNDVAIGDFLSVPTINTIQQNPTIPDYYDIYLSANIQSSVSIGTKLTFERGSSSIWTILNTPQTSTSLTRYYTYTLNTDTYYADLLSSTSSTTVVYPLYTKSIKVRTTINLQQIIPLTNLISEEWSVYLQLCRNNTTVWDSLIITNYSLSQTVTQNGITYYDYFINFKYPCRIEINSTDIVQYCIIYRNVIGNIPSYDITSIVPGISASIAFESTYVSIGSTFNVSKITTDDANNLASASTNYPQFATEGITNPTLYVWSPNDIDNDNYPSGKSLQFSGTINYYNAPVYSNPTVSTPSYYTNFITAQLSVITNDRTDVLNKNRVLGQFFVNESYQSPGLTVGGDPTTGQSLSYRGIYDVSIARGHSGVGTNTPITFVALYPINSGSESPRLISNITSTTQTSGILLSNLIQPIQSVTYNSRIGSSEPAQLESVTKYWRREFPNDENIGNNWPKYIKINDEVIRYTGYTLVSDNTYELTGVQRAQLGSTSSTHTASVANPVIIRFALDARIQNISNTTSGFLNTDGTIKSTTATTIYWRETTVVTDSPYLNSNDYTKIGKAKGDTKSRFAYQLPVYGPGNFINGRTLTKVVQNVNKIENSITLDNTIGLSPNMIITGLIGLVNGTGNDAKISSINHYQKKIFLTSTGTIFDNAVSNMVGNTASFKFSSASDGAHSIISLNETVFNPFRRIYYGSFPTSTNRLKYYLEPYPIENRAYEDIFGSTYQALVKSRNLLTGIPDDTETYYTPRSTSETFVIQASRDQFFSNQSVFSERIKYLNETITDGETIILNDSSGIDVGDTIYGSNLPSTGAVISNIEKYDANSSLLLYPGSASYTNVWFDSYPSTTYSFIFFLGSDGANVTTGMNISGTGIAPNTTVVSKGNSGTNYFYVYLSNPLTSTVSGTITFGSGYYSPARVKVRTKRDVNSGIQRTGIVVYDYRLANFNGQSCARFKIRTSDLRNTTVNISYISKLDNKYFNPDYTFNSSVILYSGIDYTAPIIGIETVDQTYSYIYTTNATLRDADTIKRYDTFTKNIPSVIEIVTFEKITTLPSTTAVNSIYKISPVPNLNKGSDYSLDSGKVTWFYSKWNAGDTTLNTYYVPDQFDPSIYWDIDRTENAKYFHADSLDSRTYTAGATSGTTISQTVTTNPVFTPSFDFVANDAVYFSNIPASLSAVLNPDTVYFILSSTLSTLSVSTTAGGSAISFPTTTNIKLKIRKAIPLFKTATGSTSGNTLTFASAQSNINVGARVYGPGINTFRTIVAKDSTSGSNISVTLSSAVDSNQTSVSFRITGVNQIKTQAIFNQLPEVLKLETLPSTGNVKIGSNSFTYTNLSFATNSYTLTVPASELNDFYLKPLTKIAVIFPTAILSESINSTKTIIKTQTTIPSSYPDYGNIKIDDEIIYYGYRTSSYFGNCEIKKSHTAGATISYNPYYSIKDNCIIYNGSDDLNSVKVIVTDTYNTNPSNSVQIKVAGLHVDPPYINNALRSENPNSLQTNQNIIISSKIDITKNITYIDDTTIQLPAGAITSQLVPGDELIIQSSYGLGSGYKISLLKDSISFYLNKPTISTSSFDVNVGTTPFRKLFVVDSEILAKLNSVFIKAASEFNNSQSFRYIPLSGCLEFKPAKCLLSKYFVQDTSKYSTKIYLCDNANQPTVLTGLTTKYSSGSTKNTGNYILSYGGNDYEIRSIEAPNIVNLTSPLKSSAKYKDTIIIKSQSYIPSYERVSNIKAIVYGPQKAILFDDYKAFIVSTFGTRTFTFNITKTISTTVEKKYSNVNDSNAFIVLNNVEYLHDDNVFVTGTGIRTATKIKNIDYKNNIVYLDKSLSAIPSGNISFNVKTNNYVTTLQSGNTNSLAVGDIVSFVVPGNINSSSVKYFVASITNLTTCVISSTNSLAPPNTIMYSTTKDNFTTRDFEIAAVDLGGAKEYQRQQIVNTSILADGTDGAIYDVETVQTRSTRDKFTTSLGKTLGKFVFQQKVLTSKNRPIYWRNVTTPPGFAVGAFKVTKFTSAIYNNTAVFFTFNGDRYHWSYDLENWTSRGFGPEINHISTTSSNNILIAFANGSFRSIPMASPNTAGNNYNVTVGGASSVRFIKRVNGYTFIQIQTGAVYYSSTDPSSSGPNSSITWNLITLNNENTVLDIIFDDYNYVIIFDKPSTTNVFKNFVLTKITGTAMNIATVTDGIKGYRNVYTAAKTTSLTYGLGKFIESGYRFTVDAVNNVYSDPALEIYDYENFSDILSPGSPENYDVKTLSFADGQFISAGFDTTTSKQFIRYSANGRNWIDVTLPSTLISSNEEITAISYGGFNRYVASVWNNSTSSNRFIISSIPSQSTTNLTTSDTNITTGKFKIIENVGGTTLYRYKSSILDGNLLAWDSQYLTYFVYDSGSPVESNELNDYKIIGCQKCSYYNNNGLIVPNFRTSSETIGANTVTTPISLYSEGLSSPTILTAGTGYIANNTYTNVTVVSTSGYSAKVTVTTNASGVVSSVVVTDPGKYYSYTEAQAGLTLQQGTGNDGQGNTFTGSATVVKFSTKLKDSNYSVYGAEANQTGYALLYKNLLNSSIYFIMFFNQNGVFIDSNINLNINDISHLNSDKAFSQSL